jgi:hypothetical protein
MNEKLTYDLIRVPVTPESTADVSDFVPSFHFIAPNHFIMEIFMSPYLLADFQVSLSSDEQSLCILGWVILAKHVCEELTKKIDYCFVFFQPGNGLPIIIGDEVTLNEKVIWKPRILDCVLENDPGFELLDK